MVASVVVCVAVNYRFVVVACCRCCVVANCHVACCFGVVKRCFVVGIGVVVRGGFALGSNSSSRSSGSSSGGSGSCGMVVTGVVMWLGGGVAGASMKALVLLQLCLGFLLDGKEPQTEEVARICVKHETVFVVIPANGGRVDGVNGGWWC